MPSTAAPEITEDSGSANARTTHPIAPHHRDQARRAALAWAEGEGRGVSDRVVDQDAEGRKKADRATDIRCCREHRHYRSDREFGAMGGHLELWVNGGQGVR